MYRRIHIAQRKLVSRNLAVRVHVPFAQQQRQLMFGKLGVDAGKRNHVKRDVPSREPGIFPFVGHKMNVVVA